MLGRINPRPKDGRAGRGGRAIERFPRGTQPGSERPCEGDSRVNLFFLPLSPPVPLLVCLKRCVRCCRCARLCCVRMFSSCSRVRGRVVCSRGVTYIGASNVRRGLEMSPLSLILQLDTSQYTSTHIQSTANHPPKHTAHHSLQSNRQVPSPNSCLNDSYSHKSCVGSGNPTTPTTPNPHLQNLTYRVTYNLSSPPAPTYHHPGPAEVDRPFFLPLVVGRGEEVGSLVLGLVLDQPPPPPEGGEEEENR